jgi:hypothetical protein
VGPTVKKLTSLFALALVACEAPTSSTSSTSTPTPARDLCSELDATLPRFAVRETETGWQRTSDTPTVDGLEDAALHAQQVEDGIVIAAVGDGACGAYGECVRGVFAICGHELVVLLAPDYFFDLRHGEGRDLVETRRLTGSQLDETERMERDEPVTAERIWRWSPRGYGLEGTSHARVRKPTVRIFWNHHRSSPLT